MYTTARESGTYTISYVTKLQLIQCYIYHSALAKLNKPGAVARSDPRPPGMRTVVGSTFMTGNILSLKLVMK